MIRRKVVVEGRVQGVFFRDATQRQAQSRGVSGSVANRGDGAVEAIFEGPADLVEELVSFCRQGPPRAEVERVEVSEEEPRGEDGFRVL